VYDGVSYRKHVSQFSAEKKAISNTAKHAHVRFIEIVTVIETDLEEKERASWREISVTSEFSVPYIPALTEVPEWCMNLTVSLKKTHGLVEL
jgi:hypothetical protein